MPASPEAILLTVAREAGLDPDKISPASTIDSLDITSLDLVSVLFALEEELGIELAPEDIQRNWTIAQFTDHVLAVAAK